MFLLSHLYMPSIPVILLCHFFVIFSDAFTLLPSNSHFIYTSLNVFITSLHNLILEKRSHGNKEIANCHLWLLLQSTSSDCLYLHMRRVIWTFKTISYNENLSKHSLISMAFPGLQWEKEESTQLCKMYYANKSSIRGFIEQYRLKQLNSNTI